MVGFAGCHVKKSLNPKRHLLAMLLGSATGAAGGLPGQEIKPAVVYGGTPMSKDKEMLKDTGDALVGVDRWIPQFIIHFSRIEDIQDIPIYHFCSPNSMFFFESRFGKILNRAG